MGLNDLLGLLIGRRQSILNIARSPAALWVGLLLVFSATMAREYDQHWLLHDWWHLLLPLGASLAISIIQFSIFWLRRPRPSDASFRESYRAFLTCFWMTAPLAWLYAIPYDRFLSEADAATANLWTLVVVSIARGLIICRVLQIIANAKFIPTFMVSLGLAQLALAVSIFVMPLPIIDIMAGLRYTEAERIMMSVGLLVMLEVMYLGWAVLLAALTAWLTLRTEWPRDRVASIGAKTSVATWALPCAVIAMFLCLLPLTQPALNRAAESDQLMVAGQIDAALSHLSQHTREDFPPHWRPLPHVAYQRRQPEFFDVFERAIELPEKSWVREYYLGEFERVFFLGTYWESDNAEERRIDALLAHPAVTSLADRHKETIRRRQEWNRPAITPATTQSNTL